jgi:hypothetical protein
MEKDDKEQRLKKGVCCQLEGEEVWWVADDIVVKEKKKKEEGLSRG